MKEPQWSDTILILMYVLLLGGMTFAWWLLWIDWGAGSAELEIGDEDSGGGRAGSSSSSTVGWLWLFGTIASLLATFGVLRHSRSRSA